MSFLFDATNEHFEKEEINLQDFFDGIITEENEEEKIFLKTLIESLIGVKDIFNDRVKTQELKIEEEKLTFANQVDCQAKLSKLAAKEYGEISVFRLYKYLTKSTNFQKLVLETTILVCVFIGLQFPVCVTSPNELFELFHSVIYIIIIK